MGMKASADGIRIAATRRGGTSMAEPRRTDTELVDNARPDETRETEHDRVRSSNDRDQAIERAGKVSERNRGYDQAVRGVEREDIDPDSAESDVDRDDTNVD
jgi:hypothetical protein